MKTGTSPKNERRTERWVRYAAALTFALTIAPAAQAQNLTMEQSVDRPGSDYRGVNIPANPKRCRQLCTNDSKCKAYTYVRPGIQGPTARCYLKNKVPAARPNDCCTSGVRRAKPATQGVFSLRTAHGKYVVAEGDGRARANRSKVGAWERWTMIKHGGGVVSFRSAHGKYLVAEKNGQANANRTKIGPWERWTMIRHGDGTVSFRSAHGKYLVAENSGELNANRAKIGTWERFTMSKAGGGQPAPQIKGHNVQAIFYSGGREIGSFRRTGRGRWAEYKANKPKPHATFTEQNRDEWSVYLRKSDGARVQLDLWKKQVLVNGRAVYNIKRSQ